MEIKIRRKKGAKVNNNSSRKKNPKPLTEATAASKHSQVTQLAPNEWRDKAKTFLLSLQIKIFHLSGSQS